MKKILVPTDFTPSSLAALKYACRLSQKLQATVVLMHCCELLDDRYNRYRTLVKEHNKTVVAKLQQKLKSLQGKMQSSLGAKVETCLYQGDDVLEIILHGITTHKIDLVVMGTYGGKGLRRKLFGSKAAAVINESPVPVITVPPGYKWSAHNEFVICISDLIEDLEAVRPFFQVANAHNGKVFAVIYSEKPQLLGLPVQIKISTYLKRKINRKFLAQNVEIVHLTGEDFYKTLIDFVRKKKIDLLSMITYKRNLLQRVFNRSMTQKMSYQTVIPLLSLQKRMPGSS
jgi:nucleotide-binding universal stress UspA family protein